MFYEFPYTDLVYSITETIDLISPILANHHKLVGYISYSLGKQLGLNVYEQIELEIAGSLHDVGGLTMVERLSPIEFDYEDKSFHSEKGYLLLSKFKPFENISKLVRYHHHGYQEGKCRGINGESIPIGSHIINLADRVSVLLDKNDENILNQADNIIDRIKKYEDSVFHPKVVQAFLELSKRESFWFDMNYLEGPNFNNKEYVIDFLTINEKEFEDFMRVISYIVDFKSRFTAAHSSTVAACAECMAKLVGFSESELKMIRYAGHIHDLGKLAIPTEILEKPAPLTNEEFSLMRAHTYHTNRVLSKIRGFDTIRTWGALHHEKLNGEGYPFKLKDNEISLGSKIMAVADIFTAVREKRPYRDSMSKENTINVLMNMANSYQIDVKIVEILVSNFDLIDAVREKANTDAVYQYEKFNSEYIKNRNAMM